MQPNKCYYRKGRPPIVGEAQSKGEDDPEDLYCVDEAVPGDKTAPAVSDTGCTIQWPS